MKFKVGDRVVPIGKSAGDPLDKSSVWKQCFASKQSFMYVTETTLNTYICDSCPDTKNGDYFLECDLVLYEDELKTGDTVIVEGNNDPRIFLFKANNLFYCVVYDDEHIFTAGYDFFRVRGWKTCKKVPPKPASVSVQLNNSHTATVSKDTIKVGCQEFPIDVIEKLIDAKNQLV